MLLINILISHIIIRLTYNNANFNGVLAAFKQITTNRNLRLYNKRILVNMTVEMAYEMGLEIIILKA